MLTPASFPSLEQYDVASRTDDRKQLSDEQWLLIADLFPWQPPAEFGGRPVVPPRAVLEALLWLLRIGGRWQDLPDWAPSESTCRRRLRKWVESGLLTEVWARLIDLSNELGEIDWEHLIADGTFCRAKKGGISWGTATRGTARLPWCSWMATAPPWAC
ncbi:transposase [Planctomicrobium sp. SH661]|uniref:transposase n=1 Tax=Planctomicrobium sp. SH661 TaxID=3448124 RepID=UPI003F5B2319